jgi:hypothetical protein
MFRTLLWTAGTEVKNKTWQYATIPIPMSPLEFKANSAKQLKKYLS